MRDDTQPVRGDAGRESGRFLDSDDLTRRPVPRMPLDPRGRPGYPGQSEQRPQEPEGYETDSRGADPSEAERKRTAQRDEAVGGTPHGASAWLTPVKPTDIKRTSAIPDETAAIPGETAVPPRRSEPVSPAARLRLEYLPAASDGIETVDGAAGSPRPAEHGSDVPPPMDTALASPTDVPTSPPEAVSSPSTAADSPSARPFDMATSPVDPLTSALDPLTSPLEPSIPPLAATPLAQDLPLVEPVVPLIEPAAPQPTAGTHIEPASATRDTAPAGGPDRDQDGLPTPVMIDPAGSSAASGSAAGPGPDAGTGASSSPLAHPATVRRPLDDAAPTPEPGTPEPIVPTPGTPEPITLTPATTTPVTPEPIVSEPVASEPGTPEQVASTPITAEPADPIEPVVSGPPAISPPGSPVAEASPDTVLPAPDGPVAGAATALRAPTMLTPVVRPDATDENADPPVPAPTAAAPEPPPPDPEQVLSSYQWRFHHETLRELVEDPDELRAIRDRLTEKLDPATDNGTRARLLSLRAVVSRILGELGKALADGKLALAHAEATGELRRVAIAQARLAHVLQWRGDFAEADRLFEEANSSELPDRLRATMHEHAGRSCYDQGRYMEACNHFERALELRKVEDPDLIARTELALDAVFSKVAQNGWGPYPRSRDEILQIHRPPTPTFSEKVQRWGYADPDGKLAVAPSYADAQPFRDGVAWVRRPETRTWELIDESGTLLVDSSAGYLGVGSFSDGLAWVSRDGTGGWVAIDKTNRLVIPIGFDDVRPFRRGIAAVRRGGGWGAVDKTGRVVVPPRYTAFTTALTDGRYLDGFTDEGLAIVDANGRKGVVDRSGRVIVPPAHPALVIHPVAFLVGNGTGQWGALDRRGEPLIDVVHPSRTDVMDEIDRLLADTKPVL